MRFNSKMPPKRKAASTSEDSSLTKKAKVNRTTTAQKKKSISQKPKQNKKNAQSKSKGIKAKFIPKVLKGKSKPIQIKAKSKAKDRKTTENNVTNTNSSAKSCTTAKNSVLNFVSYIKDAGWASALKDEFQKDYFKDLEVLLQKDYKKGVQVFPPKDLIFNAFNKTPLDQVKVVILGQDPYHDDGQAMGMSFSVPDGMRLPPSLKNIYKELVNDQNIKNFNVEPATGCLEKWAERGVLLINATLTVEAHKPNSHAKYGWQTFTDDVIRIISSKCSGVVFVLWGNFAHKKEKLIDSSRHSVIKTAHPSPLSFSKWLGCKCFSNVNAQLKKWNKEEINWTL
ncbi:uracil-DNA glycosylase-like isoform X2 [Mytilus galloprovincialis]|uniref:uracil-DNA glycosylase-like isoform X2 n=1 Tax=Mytilus galloprovincialis TaxID=29158 RepID=UPI003F7C2079